MMPGEADILAKETLVIVSNVAAKRQRPHRFSPEIRAVARRESERPHFVRPKPDATAYSWVVEIHPRDWPRFRPRRKRRVLHLGRIIELADPARHRNARRVAWPPNHRVVFVFVSRNSDTEVTCIRRGFVFDRGDILVGQWRVDERIVPGKMSRHPVANDGGELAGLDSEPAVFPRRDADCIFVQSDLRSMISRIETAVDARLRENVNRRPDLRVEEQTQARIKERVTRRPDQTRRRPTESVAFEVQRAADTCPDIVVKSSERERLVNAVQEILGLRSRNHE